MDVKAPIIAIVGRPNVGKSTFFNYVVGFKKAVVEDLPGVTRDRNYEYVTRYEIPFFLVDTGGFEKENEDPVQKQILDQTLIAIDEADCIVVLFDGNSGAHPGDDDLVAALREAKKPVFYVVNKCDGKEQEEKSYDFYRFGVDSLSTISGLYGHGVLSLLDSIFHSFSNYEELKVALRREKEKEEVLLEQSKDACEKFVRIEEEEGFEEEVESYTKPSQGTSVLSDASSAAIGTQEVSFSPVFIPGSSDLSEKEYERRYRTVPLVYEKGVLQRAEEVSEEAEAIELPKAPEIIKVAIIGRPNVGKSSLLNALLKEERVITSPIAGTTRDAIDVSFEHNGQKYQLIDTAGLRKQARVSEDVEQYSGLRALRAIRDCDVAIVMIDGAAGPTEQDAKILGMAHEEGKGIVIGVNKWDLVEKDHKTVTTFKEKIQETFKFAPYAPVSFISAKSGRRCFSLLEETRQVSISRLQRVTTWQVNKVLRRAISRRDFSTYRGQKIKLFFATQIDTAPPRFLLFFNYPKEVHFSHLRHLKNAIREEFGFLGTDIKFSTRKR